MNSCHFVHVKLLQSNILYLLFLGGVQAQWYRCDRSLQTAAEVHLCCAAVLCLHWCGGEYGGQVPRTGQKPDRSVFRQEHCRGRNRESPFCLGSYDVSLRTCVTDLWLWPFICSWGSCWRTGAAWTWPSPGPNTSWWWWAPSRRYDATNLLRNYSTTCGRRTWYPLNTRWCYS